MIPNFITEAMKLNDDLQSMNAYYDMQSTKPFLAMEFMTEYMMKEG